MAITTYAELQTAIANWMNRTDLTTRIPEFIQLAEDDMNEVLRTRKQIQRSYTTLTGEFVAVPTDFLAFRNVDVTSGGKRYPVKYESPEYMDRKNDGSSGRPYFFTILGGEMQLYPPPDTGLRLDITYFQKIPSLSDTNTTNWVLDDHSKAYLHGALVHANQYVKNLQAAGEQNSQFRSALQSIQSADKRDKYSGSSLQIRLA